ncbi:MAG: hypothetical protein JWM90_1198 [Thermoleophilia bacterium]|nr:hypothetical protein [Thermoleophilia bacterium]
MIGSTNSRIVVTLARHEYRAAARNRVLAALVLVLVAITTVSVLIGAIDYHSQVADYQRYVAAARSSGVTQTAPLPLQVLSLLRGAFEYLEIIGAIIAIVLGYMSIARERTSNTLMLLQTRPITSMQRALGSALGALAIIATLLLVTGAIAVLCLGVIGGDWLAPPELLKLTLALLATIPYMGAFYCLGVVLTAHARSLSNGLMAALVIWLAVVLIIPQVGDTMDPDNQVPGGLFQSLGVDKPTELKVLAKFTTYEKVRNDLEEASLAKHYERFTFGMTDVKDKYRGFTLTHLLHEKRNDIAWLAAYMLVLGAALHRSYQRQPALPRGGTP